MMGASFQFVMLTFALALAATRISLVSSLRCFRCSSFENQNCDNLDEEVYEECPKNTTENVIEDVKEGGDGRIAMCLTLSFRVLQEFEFKDSRGFDHVNKMTSPRYRRFCGMGKASEADKCITKNSRAIRYNLCACTTEFCNDVPFESSSTVWIYLLVIFLSLGVVGFFGFVIYRKSKTYS